MSKKKRNTRTTKPKKRAQAQALPHRFPLTSEAKLGSYIADHTHTRGGTEAALLERVGLRPDEHVCPACRSRVTQIPNSRAFIATETRRFVTELLEQKADKAPKAKLRATTDAFEASAYRRLLGVCTPCGEYYARSGSLTAAGAATTSRGFHA